MSEYPKKSILVIEDDPLGRQYLCDLLEEENYTVYASPNGKNGMKLFNEHNPDLVVTDIFMPEVDGMELLLDLKEKHNRIPIIAISGGSRFGGGPTALMAAGYLGAVCMEKPLHLEKFLKTIKCLI